MKTLTPLSRPCAKYGACSAARQNSFHSGSRLFKSMLNVKFKCDLNGSAAHSNGCDTTWQRAPRFRVDFQRRRDSVIRTLTALTRSFGCSVLQLPGLWEDSPSLCVMDTHQKNASTVQSGAVLESRGRWSQGCRMRESGVRLQKWMTSIRFLKLELCVIKA